MATSALCPILLLCFTFVSCRVSADVQKLIPGVELQKSDVSVEVVDDRNGVMVMEFLGNYDKDLPSGESNSSARASVAKKFYQHRQDNYDFLVVFTGFDVEFGEAIAFNTLVSNSVEGTGLELFSNGPDFGNSERLKGFIDMGSLESIELNPTSLIGADPSKRFDAGMKTLAHEMLHNWAVHLDIDNIVGNDGSHWSFFLDSDASVQYGHDWVDNGDGSFTAVSTREKYSKLDLYLMGLAEKEEVPDSFIIIPDDETFSAEELPKKGVTIFGQRHPISIEDIVEIHGERLPIAANSQKSFNLGFVYLIPAGKTLAPAGLVKISNFKNEFEKRFSILTDGRAIANVDIPYAATDMPGNLNVVSTEGELDHSALNIDAAIQWLRENQLGDGSWSDKPETMIRDTSVVVKALQDNLSFESRRAANDWLKGQLPENLDSSIRLISASNNESQVLELLSTQNIDGGWGLVADYQSSVLDTAYASCALSLIENQSTDVEASVRRGKAFVFSKRLSDGGWSHQNQIKASTNLTAEILRLLACVGVNQVEVESSLDWLIGRVGEEGGFGDVEPNSATTAHSLLALTEFNVLGRISSAESIQFLEAQQSTNGDWGGSVYTTARVVQAIRAVSLPNLTIVSMSAEPTVLVDGELSKLDLEVRNSGSASSTPTTIKLESSFIGSQPMEFESIQIPELVPGQALNIRTYWSSFGAPQSISLLAEIDANELIAESSESDNGAQVLISISPPPVNADLIPLSEGSSSIPSTISQLPESIYLEVPVRNIGMKNAGSVQVELWRGSPNIGELLGEQIISIPARSTGLTRFNFTQDGVKDSELYVAVDRRNNIEESDESNNDFIFQLEIVDSTDIGVTSNSFQISAPPNLVNQPQDVSFSVSNLGTTTIQQVGVLAKMSNPQESVELANIKIDLEAGETRELRSLWLPTEEGAYQFVVSTDAENLLAESNENNNVAELNLEAELLNGQNLSISFQDVSISPEIGLQGMGSTISAKVANTGTSDIAEVNVDYFDGNPDAGGALIGSSSALSLKAGEVKEVNIVWPEIEVSGKRFVLVVVDAQNLIDEINKSDNRAFVEYQVESLPDLEVSSASLSTEPGIPRINEPTQISVDIFNLGLQTASDFEIEAYLEGEVSGQPISQDTFTIGAGESLNWTFEHTFKDVGGQKIDVIVDRQNFIAEISELNNQASIEVEIQATDMFVSNRFISPNGDGVHDSVEIGISTSTLQPTYLVVIDQYDRELAVLEEFEAGVLSESVIWDGKNRFGGIVSDGRYRIVLQSVESELADVSVVLDTNRSHLSDAIDTEFGVERNLSCKIGEIRESSSSSSGAYEDALLYGPSSKFVYFLVDFEPYLNDQGELITTDPEHPFPKGLYRANADGTRVEQLLSNTDFPLDGITSFGISKDGKRLFLEAEDGGGHVLSTLEIANRELQAVLFFSELGEIKNIQFLPDGDLIFEGFKFSNSGARRIWRIADKTDSLPKLVYEATQLITSRVFTRLDINELGTHAVVPRDERKFNTTLESYNELLSTRLGYQLEIVDLESGQVTKLDDFVTAHAWSPNGKSLAAFIAETGQVKILDLNGQEVVHFDVSQLQSKQFTAEDRDSFDFFFRDGLLGGFASSQDLGARYFGQALEIVWHPDSTELIIHLEDHLALLLQGEVCSVEGEVEGNLKSSQSVDDLKSADCEPIASESNPLAGKYQSTDGLYVASLLEASLEKIAVSDLAIVLAPPPIFGKPQDQSYKTLKPVLAKQNSVATNDFGVELDNDGLPILNFQQVLIDVRSGRSNRIVLRPQSYQPRIVWFGGAREIIVNVLSDDEQERRLVVEPLLIDLDNPGIESRRVFTDYKIASSLESANDDSALHFDSNTGVTLTASDRFLSFFSRHDSSSCTFNEIDGAYYQFQSLLNLTAVIRARKTSSGAFILEGSAADANFDRYELHYSDVTNPDNWLPLTSPGSESVINGRFTYWSAPYVGSFLLRLTVHDKAGNQRQDIVRVFNQDLSSITDIDLSLKFFSPNGDGVKDATQLKFRVLENTNLEFSVHDENGLMVRKISNSYDLIGAVESIEWDGRDVNFRIVPDGNYTIKILDFEFIVTVDNSPPRLEDNSPPLFVPAKNDIGQTLDGLNCFAPLLKDLEFCSVREENTVSAITRDVNLEYVSLQKRVLESDQWLEVPVSIQQVDNTGMAINAWITSDVLRTSELRLVASDKAGNKRLLDIGLGKLDKAHILGFDSRSSFLESGFGYSTTLDYGLFSEYRARQAISKSLEQAGLPVYFQYSSRMPATGYQLMYLSSEPEAQMRSWDVNVAAVQLPRTLSSGFIFTLKEDQVRELIVGDAAYFVRVNFEDGSHLDTDSQFIVAGNQFQFDEESASFTPDINLNLQTGVPPFYRERLLIFIESRGAFSDPRYLRRDIVSSEGELKTKLESGDFSPGGVLVRNAEAAQLISDLGQISFYELSNPNRGVLEPNISLIAECGYSYRANAVLILANGDSVDTFIDFNNSCINLQVDVDPILQGQCSSLPSGAVNIALRALTLNQNYNAKPVFVEVREFSADSVGNNNAQLVFRENLPLLNQIYSFELNVTEYPEGAHRFVAAIALESGEVIEHEFVIPVVHTAPEIQTTYPREGDRLCATNFTADAEELKKGIEIQGRITSVGPEISLAVDDRTSDKLAKVRLGLIPSFGRYDSYDNNLVGNPINASATDQALFRRTDSDELVIESPIIFDSSSFTTKVNGLLAVPFFNRDQLTDVQVRASNWSGAETCETLSVYIDASIEGLDIGMGDSVRIVYEPLGENLVVFSPGNKDGRYDEITLNYSVAENVEVDLQVHQTSVDVDGDLIREDIVATPYERFSITAPGSVISWNGTHDNGEPVMDGVYIVVVTSTDACGNESLREFRVVVDNTKPLNAITYPTNQSPSSLVIYPTGLAEDLNPSNDPSSTVLSALNTAVQQEIILGSRRGNFNGAIGEWDTVGLIGDWTLRMESEDAAGNRSTTEQLITLKERENLIIGLDATNYLMSPNSDGRNDQLTLRVSLSSPAVTNVRVLDESENEVALLTNAPFESGTTTVSWTGRNFAGDLVNDGVYFVEVSAVSADVLQVELLQFEIDSLAPLVILPTLVNGIIQLHGQRTINGTISDRNFESFVVSLERPIGGDAPIELNRPIELASSSLPTAALIAEIPEELYGNPASYNLKISARDYAGNVRVVNAEVFLDETKPSVSIDSPAQQQIFGQERRLSVYGSVNDEFLESYQLTLAAENEPGVSIKEIQGSNISSGLLGEFLIEELADGRYNLRLIGIDQNGNVGSVVRSFELDRSPPMVEIISPLEGGYLGENFEIFGSASDKNFGQFTLSFSAGHNAEVTASQILAISSKPVEASTVFAWPIAPRDGPYSLFLNARDSVGNSAMTARNILIDTTAPDPVRITRAEFDKQSQETEITWEASSDSALRGYYLYRNNFRLSSTPLLDSRYTDSNLPAGNYDYHVEVVDQAGLVSEPSAKVKVEVDNTPPKVQILSPVDGARVNLVQGIVGTAFSDGDFQNYSVSVNINGAGFEELINSPLAIQGGELVQWDTTAITEGQAVIIRLQATDLNGNVAAEEITVSVDNKPPAPPLLNDPLLVDSNSFRLSWNQQVEETDIFGYVAFRGDVLLGVDDSFIEDLRSVAIKDLNFVDTNVPDGNHEWVVHAIDNLGNLSVASNSVTVSVDTRAPSVEFSSPEPDDRFDESLFIKAVSEDKDIANVLFQFRREGELLWIDIFSDNQEPYEHLWITQEFGDGNYQIRALATDIGGLTDASPPSINIVKGDVTPPTRVEAVLVSVIGSEGALSWGPAQDEDIEGYRIYVAICETCEPQVIAELPSSQVEYQDVVTENGERWYTVRSVDQSGNIGFASQPAVAGYYIDPLLSVSPIVSNDGVFDVLVSNKDGLVKFESSIVTLISTDGIEFQNSFSSSSPLENFKQTIQASEIGLFRAKANTSALEPAYISRESSSIKLLNQGVPAQASAPTGAFNQDELAVVLQWLPNEAADRVIGYQVFRDGLNLSPAAVVEDASAFSSTGNDPDNFLPSSLSFATWDAAPLEGVSFGQVWPAPRLVESLQLNWFSELESARTISIQALVDSEYITLLSDTKQDDASSVDIVLPDAIATTSIRIVVDDPTSREQLMRLSEFLINAQAIGEATEFTETYTNAPDLSASYQVRAINRYGGVSELSSQIKLILGDVTPPEPVLLELDEVATPVTLRWNALPDNEVIYEIYLDDEFFGETQSAIFELPEFSNGVYQFHVVSVDGQGRNSAPSNTASLTVSEPILEAPVNLSGEYDELDKLAHLAWEAFPNSNPSRYRIYLRPTLASTEFDFVEETEQLSFSVTLNPSLTSIDFYITAVDELNNESEPSQLLTLTIPLASFYTIPRLLTPPGLVDAFASNENQASLSGFAEPGSQTFLINNGQLLPRSEMASQESTITPLIGLGSRFKIQAGKQVGTKYLVDVIDEFLGQRYIAELSNNGITALQPVSLWEGVNFENTVATSEGNLLLRKDDSPKLYNLFDNSLTDIDFSVFANVDIGTVIGFNEEAEYAVTELIDGNDITKIYKADLKTGVFSEVFEGDIYQLSQGAKYLASIQRDDNSNLAVGVLDLQAESESLTPILGADYVDFVYGEQSWTMNEASLVLEGSTDGDDQVLFVLNHGNQQVRAIELAGHFLYSPAWINNGDLFFLAENEESDEGGAELYFSSQILTERVAAWPSSEFSSRHLLFLNPQLDFFIGNSYGLEVIDLFVPAGVFNHSDADLEAGLNQFLAVSSNAEGDTSISERELFITYDSAGKSDLVGELTFNSSYGILNQPLALGLQVNNDGSVLAAESTLNIRIFNSSGDEVFIENIQVRGLADGEAISLTLDWIPRNVGEHIVQIVVDSENANDESNEANNIRLGRIQITESTAVIVDVDVGLSQAQNLQFGPDQTVSGSVTLRSTTSVSSGSLIVSILNSEQEKAEELLAIQVSDLLQGQPFSFDFDWRSSEFLLGSYEIRATFTDFESDELSQSSTYVELVEPLQMVLGLNANRFIYSENEDVRFIATLINRSKVASLNSGRLILNISTENGSEIYSSISEITQLNATDTVSIPFSWNTEVEEPGDYFAKVELISDQAENISATTRIQIRPSEATLVGNLSLAAFELEVDGEVSLSAEILNRGNLATSDLLIEYLLVGDQRSEILASQIVTPLAAQEAELLGETLSLIGLNLGQYRIQLLASSLNSAEPSNVLDEESFTVRETSPPIVTIESPVNSAIINGRDFHVTANVEDRFGVQEVAISLDNSSSKTAFASITKPKNYQAPFSELSERQHSVYAEATDLNGNVGRSHTQTFTIDNTPPTINVLNILDGQIFESPVLPEFSVTDLHLAKIESRVNGIALAEELSVPGDYQLVIDAIDKAGNSARKALTFSIAEPSQVEGLSANKDQLNLSRGVWGTVTLLDNDVVPNPESTSLRVISTPKSGSLISLGAGRFNYFPNLLFVGVDRFEYEISDAETMQVSRAMVEIDVAPVADCSFVPDHTVSSSGEVVLSGWAAKTKPVVSTPKYQIQIKTVSDISAFEQGGLPQVSYPACDLVYTPKSKTHTEVEIRYQVIDAATRGQSYTSPERSFTISIDNVGNSQIIVIPLLKLLLLDEDD